MSAAATIVAIITKPDTNRREPIDLFERVTRVGIFVSSLKIPVLET
jgi:hypothetical protein